MEYRTVVKDYVVRDRHFAIVQEVKDDGWYMAVEYKYIGEDGRLTTSLNGFNTHAHKELDMCLRMTQDCVEADYLMEQGHSKAEAFAIVFGLEDQIEHLEKLFNV